MKIEICESLIFSWLRHVQGCIVTQMNWKPSPTWAVARDGELAEAFDDIRNFSGQAIGLPISSYVVQMLPYIIALAVLAGMGRSTRLPAAIGIAYDPKGR